MWCRSSGEMIPPDINSTFISAVCIMHKVTFGLNDSMDMYNFLMLCHSTCSELVPGYKRFWLSGEYGEHLDGMKMLLWHQTKARLFHLTAGLLCTTDS